MIWEVLAIDPGVHAVGWAASSGGVLSTCGLSRSREDAMSAAETHAHNIGHGRAHLVVLESMVYRAADGRSQAQDLIDVQTVGVHVAARVGSKTVLVTPAEWKGSIPKGIHHDRILEALSLAERQRVDAAVLFAGRNRKEVLDAVGILLYHLKRTNRSGGVRR